MAAVPATPSTGISGLSTLRPPSSTSHIIDWLHLLLPPSESKQSRVYVGEGLPSIPKKLQERIGKSTYSLDRNMWTLLISISQGPHAPRWWTQKLVLKNSLCSQRWKTIPDLMAYMILIIRTHRDYEDIAWRRYDEVFCEKAAVTENHKWDTIDPDLYNRICSGKAIALQAKTSFGPRNSSGHPSIRRPHREPGTLPFCSKGSAKYMPWLEHRQMHLQSL